MPRVKQRAAHTPASPTARVDDGSISVVGASAHNLRDVSVSLPRGELVACTGVSGSGKSSLAFSTIYAEAQRRYLDTISPYARRLLGQMEEPQVEAVHGLPPAVALGQRRGQASSRSSVGSLTTISNLVRLLYSRCGQYPRGLAHLPAEAFSPNTPAGACESCSGLGEVHDVTEALLVPDPSKSIRDGAIAAWPGAWQGANLRSIVMNLGIDIDQPFKDLPKKTREWLLYTDEQPSVLITPQRDRVDHGYYGKFWSARAHIHHVLNDSQSEQSRSRALRFTEAAACRKCGGSGLRAEALKVRFAGRSIAELAALPLTQVGTVLADPALEESVAGRLCREICERASQIEALGLGYLSLDRSSTTLSSGEAQRLRIATALHSTLFGVVYVLDEPSAGLHPRDTEALMETLTGLRDRGNSLILVEHDMQVVSQCSYVVDVGPGAGAAGGEIVYSGPVSGLSACEESVTGRYLGGGRAREPRLAATPTGELTLRGVTGHNLRDVEVAIPLGCLVGIAGVSGSGKSTLVAALRGGVGGVLGSRRVAVEESQHQVTVAEIVGAESLHRLVEVGSSPIGRSPRSNLATYTGLLDVVRRRYAATPMARRRGYDAGRFSFNVEGGRCETCEGAGEVAVELVFLPGQTGSCPQCQGRRYNEATLEVKLSGRSIADVLALTVDEALEALSDEPSVVRSLTALRDVGLGYVRLGQAATTLSGGEAQRVKLAAELQRPKRAGTLYLLDEPTTGLHPSDAERLGGVLERLVEEGSTVVVVEHELPMLSRCDWILEMGPGGGDRGGKIVAAGTPTEVAAGESSTSSYLGAHMRLHRS